MNNDVCPLLNCREYSARGVQRFNAVGRFRGAGDGLVQFVEVRHPVSGDGAGEQDDEKEAFDRCLTDVFPNAWIGSFVEFEHPCKRGNQDDAQHERRRNTDDQRHPTERMGAMGTMSGAISTENSDDGGHG